MMQERRTLDRPSLVVLAAAIAILGVIAVHLGADSNGDLRNYHYYGGWALLHKQVGYDLAPAQLQTYHHPLLDALYYVVSRALNRHPLAFTFVWSIPQSVAVWLAFLIARQCLGFVARGRGRGRDGLALIAAAIGAGGATSIGVIGTSMSEGVPNALMLAAIWLVLRADGRMRAGLGGAAGYGGAGLLAGAGAVLKLTTTPYLIGFAAAIPAAMLLEPRVGRWRGLVAFGAGAAGAIAVVGGPWWLAVYRAFGNPLFPYYNTVFHSPLYLDQDFFDTRFLPQSVREWVLYPLEWGLRRSTRVSEMPARDLRILLELLAGLGVVGAAVIARWRGRLPPERVAAVWCAVYVIAAYVVWLKMFSILRYASGLETLSGVMIVAGLALLPVGVWPQAGAALAVAVLLAATTVVPTWERRVHPGKRLVGTDMPTLPADSTVLVLGPFEKAFLAPFEPVSVRWIGIQDSLVTLDNHTGFEALIGRTVAAAPGPIWDMVDGATPPDAERQWLIRFHLQRGLCQTVTATIAPPMTLCRLERTDNPRP